MWNLSIAELNIIGYVSRDNDNVHTSIGVN